MLEYLRLYGNKSLRPTCASRSAPRSRVSFCTLVCSQCSCARCASAGCRCGRRALGGASAFPRALPGSRCCFSFLLHGCLPPPDDELLQEAHRLDVLIEALLAARGLARATFCIHLDVLGRVVEKVKESQTASLPRLCSSPPKPLSCPRVRSGPRRRPCGTPSPVHRRSGRPSSRRASECHVAIVQGTD